MDAQIQGKSESIRNPVTSQCIRGGGVLLTGGSGLLGSRLCELLQGVTAPTSTELDITKFETMRSYIGGLKRKPRVIVHAAAYTNTRQAQRDVADVIDKNIIGTSNVVRLCAEHNWRLVYISTDYVFKGDRGNYSEDSEVLPSGAYAWSKLGGECAARVYQKSLIVRTSFGPEPFPFDKAFVDQWTSKIGVTELAQKLIPVILDDNLFGVIHIGSPRRTVWDYALSISDKKKIEASSRSDSDVAFPKDTSLDCSKYHSLYEL